MSRRGMSMRTRTSDVIPNEVKTYSTRYRTSPTRFFASLRMTVSISLTALSLGMTAVDAHLHSTSPLYPTRDADIQIVHVQCGTTSIR
jgi:hypothetical protein